MALRLRHWLLQLQTQAIELAEPRRVAAPVLDRTGLNRLSRLPHAGCFHHAFVLLVAQAGIRTDQGRDHFSAFALGNALDDLGDHGQAIVHFDEANRLENLCYSFDPAAHRTDLDRTIALYSADFLRSQAATANPGEGPLLTVGMMRSGTTLVEQIVSSYPEIGAEAN